MADRRDTDDLLGMIDRVHAGVVRLRDENARLRRVVEADDTCTQVDVAEVAFREPEVSVPVVSAPEMADTAPPGSPDQSQVSDELESQVVSTGEPDRPVLPAFTTLPPPRAPESPRRPIDAPRSRPVSAPIAAGRSTAPGTTPPADSTRRGPEELVRVFRSLFRGRDDVYAIPRLAADGTPGFAEARVRASDGREDRLPLTDGVVRNHLGGRRTIGIYPLLPDGTCWFLALELVGAGWRPRAAALLSACRDARIDVAIERVSTGIGARAWIFFDAPAPAPRARALAFRIVGLARRHGMSDPESVRVYPDLDAPSEGDLGSAIALPLDRDPVSEEHSSFVDDRFQPFPDQWTVLAALRRLSLDELDPSTPGPDGDSPAGPAPSGGGSEPERRLANPAGGARIQRSNILLIDATGIEGSARAELVRLAEIFAPPGEPTGDDASALPFRPSEPDATGRIALARGAYDELIALLERSGIEPDIHDERVDGPPLTIRFQGETRPQIDAAVAAALRRDSCVVTAGSTADLYTLVAQMIAGRGRATLVLVRRRRDLDAWQDALARRLDMATSDVGLVGDGKDRRTGLVDVAVAASAVRGSDVKPWVLEYGHVIVDSCQRIGNATLTRLLGQLRPRFLLGITTKSAAAGSLDLPAAVQFSPHAIEVASTARNGAQAVIVRATGFQTEASDVDTEHRQLIAALAVDDARNELIARDVAGLALSGLRPLVLTERTDHARELAERLERLVPASGRLASEAGRRQRALTLARLKDLPDSEPWALVASTRFAIDGLGTNRIGALVLAMPYPFRGDFERVLGHIWRRYGTRGAIKVYDFVDEAIPALVRMYWRRRAGYVSLGAVIESEPEMPALRAIAARRGPAG